MGKVKGYWRSRNGKKHFVKEYDRQGGNATEDAVQSHVNKKGAGKQFEKMKKEKEKFADEKASPEVDLSPTDTTKPIPVTIEGKLAAKKKFVKKKLAELKGVKGMEVKHKGSQPEATLELGGGDVRPRAFSDKKLSNKEFAAAQAKLTKGGKDNSNDPLEANTRKLYEAAPGKKNVSGFPSASALNKMTANQIQEAVGGWKHEHFEKLTPEHMNVLEKKGVNIDVAAEKANQANKKEERLVKMAGGRIEYEKAVRKLKQRGVMAELSGKTNKVSERQSAREDNQRRGDVRESNYNQRESEKDSAINKYLVARGYKSNRKMKKTRKFKKFWEKKSR